MNYLTQVYNALTKSVKQVDRRLLLVVLYDVIFFLVLVAAWYVWLSYFGHIGSQLEVASIGNIYQDVQKAEQFANGLERFFINLLFSMFLVYIVFSIDWAVMKGLLWTTLLKKKFTGLYLKKFLLLSFVWFFVWFIVIFAVAMISQQTKSPFMVLLVSGLLVHFSWILKYRFTKVVKIRQALRETFTLGTKKVHYFLLPYLIILLLYYVIVIVLQKLPIPANVGLIGSVIIIVVYMAIARLFLVNVAKIAED